MLMNPVKDDHVILYPVLGIRKKQIMLAMVKYGRMY